MQLDLGYLVKSLMNILEHIRVKYQLNSFSQLPYQLLFTRPLAKPKQPVKFYK